MLTIFPNPYPDEILYSVIARYYIRCGSTSPKFTLGELFNNTNLTATVDLPCNINALIKNLADFSNYKAENFIINNTLYPLYAPFMPKERAKLIYKSMGSNYGGNISNRAGIMANGVHNPKYLRFCPECFNEDMSKYGEAYWHRIHQVPGVIVCPKHNEFLLDSCIPWHGMNKHEFIAANNENCVLYKIKDTFTENEFKKLSTIAKDAAWILNAELRSKQLNWFRDKYIKLLFDKGLASTNGRIMQQYLLEQFKCYYGENILNYLNSNVNISFYDNWLSRMVRKSNEFFHPIRHILLINFLGLSAVNFFCYKSTNKPFGTGPWPCLNKAADHYKENVIGDVIITYDNKVKRPVGAFRCECGFVYSRRGPDASDADKYRVGRIKKFGLVWEQKLKELSSIKNISYREIARVLNVDTKTAINQLKKLSSKDVKNDINSIKDKDLEKAEHRKRWLSLKNQNSKMTKTQLRDKDKATYSWLYKHDRDWLYSLEYPLTDKIYINNRVDWESRDKEVLSIAKHMVKATINKSGKPERITISRIGKKIGLVSLLEKHMDKLPKTKKYFDKAAESVESYQIRRIKWAVNELFNEEKKVNNNAVLRKACIRANCSRIVFDALEQEISRYYKVEKVN